MRKRRAPGTEQEHSGGSESGEARADAAGEEVVLEPLPPPQAVGASACVAVAAGADAEAASPRDADRPVVITRATEPHTTPLEGTVAVAPPLSPPASEMSGPAEELLGAAGQQSLGNAAPVLLAAEPTPTEAWPAVPEFFTIEQLRVLSSPKVDVARKEWYLSDSDFATFIGMSKIEFVKQPTWKRNKKKKDLGIF